MNNKMLVSIMIFGIVSIYNTTFSANGQDDALSADYFGQDKNVSRSFKVLEVRTLCQPGTIPVICQVSPNNQYCVEIVPKYPQSYTVCGIQLDKNMLLAIQNKLVNTNDSVFYVTLQKEYDGKTQKIFAPATVAIWRNDFDNIQYYEQHFFWKNIRLIIELFGLSIFCVALYYSLKIFSVGRL